MLPECLQHLGRGIDAGDIVTLSLEHEAQRLQDIILIVDNCFATPYLQQPLALGAHIIVHSGTKFIDGQGRVMGGAILGPADLIEEIEGFTKAAGPALSPFNGWVLSKSLETLAVRMDAHCTRALALAERLETNPHVCRVKYPFLPSHPQYDLARKQMRAGGGLVTFEVKGGLEQGQRFLDALQIMDGDELRMQLKGPLESGVINPVGDDNFKYILMPMQIS